MEKYVINFNIYVCVFCGKLFVASIHDRHVNKINFSQAYLTKKIFKNYKLSV